MKNITADKDGLSVKKLALGVVVSLIVGIVCAGVIAFLTGKGTLAEDNMKTAVILSGALAAFAGCLIGTAGTRSGILVAGGIVTAVYLGLLLVVNLLFFEEGIRGFLPTVLSAAAGGVVAMLVNIRGKSTKKRRKRMAR